METRYFCSYCKTEIEIETGHFNLTSGHGLCEHCYQESCEKEYFNSELIQQ